MNYYKYPRTSHLPWSPGVGSDDLVLPLLGAFSGKNVIVTEKMDGENTSLYRGHIHARSMDSRNHPSRNWLKRWHANMAHDIPEGWRICGENLYARHSIAYDDLLSYFYAFSIWDSENTCLSWEGTQEWADILNLTLPEVIYQGIWDEALI
jgi:hypothetical protein